MNTITVVISAYNEELKIQKVLESVSWADEIVVVDNQSSDSTLSLLQKTKAKVFVQKNNQMLNINKNFGFSKAKSDWILNLDADEVVTDQLREEIRKILNENAKCNGFWIPRKNIIFGKWIQHGLWWPDKQLRLFRRGTGRFACKHVHEYLEVDGDIGVLDNPLIHNNYETITQFIRKMDTIYTENEVKNITEQKKDLLWYEAIRMPVNDFVKVFFFQAGYRDGLHGLVLAIFQAFYAFVVYAKVWEKQQFTQKDLSLNEIQQELTAAKDQIAYWQYTERLKEIKNPIYRFIIKIKRKYNV